MHARTLLPIYTVLQNLWLKWFSVIYIYILLSTSSLTTVSSFRSISYAVCKSSVPLDLQYAWSRGSQTRGVMRIQGGVRPSSENSLFDKNNKMIPRTSICRYKRAKYNSISQPVFYQGSSPQAFRTRRRGQPHGRGWAPCPASHPPGAAPPCSRERFSSDSSILDRTKKS